LERGRRAFWRSGGWRRWRKGTDGYAEEGEGERFSEDEPENILTMGADGDANADFAGAAKKAESKAVERSSASYRLISCGIVLVLSAYCQPMTHPPGGPSKIAAGTSASGLSPTEAEVRTACLRVWRY
jgi:hypothetical protein